MTNLLDIGCLDCAATIGDTGEVEALADGRINAAKQAHRTLEKWERKGLYDYGVALDMGWIVRQSSTSKSETAEEVPTLPPSPS